MGRLKTFFRDASIRNIIFVCFTVSALATSLIISIFLYTRMSDQLIGVTKQQNEVLVNQVNRSVETYLQAARKLSDTIYYGVIKNADLSEDRVAQELSLLYGSSDSVENIAIFSWDGTLLESFPAARVKKGKDVRKEAWFETALEKTENIHFFLPQVQRIFETSENQYQWVIPMARAVEITQGGSTWQGVLLINLSYTSLEMRLERVNLGGNGYMYLTDGDGRLISHPRIQLIDSGLEGENNLVASQLSDGVHWETFERKKRAVTVKSVGYTGWKLINVDPTPGLSLNTAKTQLLILSLVSLLLFLMSLINAYISARITGPIRNLEAAIGEIEDGNLEVTLPKTGSYEIRRLAGAIENMTHQIRCLMADIVAEHESKRKSELDALQSQINPHFLYNTLDIIVWMIENEKPDQAVKVVTALARFFRISLSKGRSIIPLRDELEHVRNYLMIQQMRFKDKFRYEIDAPEELLDLASLKLSLQPLVENAIYHGMEFMDGDGLVTVQARLEGEFLLLSVSDNGLGMTPEQVERLFSKEHVKSRRGSGIGVRNVDQRIRLYFGEECGLSIWSEPDEGTCVTLRIPAIPYREWEEKHDKK